MAINVLLYIGSGIEINSYATYLFKFAFIKIHNTYLSAPAVHYCYSDFTSCAETKTNWEINYPDDLQDRQNPISLNKLRIATLFRYVMVSNLINCVAWEIY